MKVRATLAAAAVLLVTLAWTFVKRPLPVPDVEGPTLPDVVAVEGVSLSLIPVAEMTSRQGLSVRGGSLSTEFITNVVAFVIGHPQGVLLIDSGIARDIDEHWAMTPFLMRTLADLTVHTSTVDALEARGIAPSDLEGIVLTHSHWDHVSGLADLRDVPVWTTPEEIEFARTDDLGGILFRELEAEGPLTLRELDFDGGPYGPFEQSADFFDDGSVVIVPLPGHTPGSLGVFVTDATGKRVLIIGDTSWTREGVEWPAEKPWLARRMVDNDPDQVREQLVRLHQLESTHPELAIVPAHDKRVHEELPTFH